MALSQVHCLDDNQEIESLEESKPEFFYSEEQRLALEALIHGGRRAFREYIQDRGVRPFLSEPEQNQLTAAAVAQQPGSEEDGAKHDEDVAGSLHYWPDRSDGSIPEFDIGWPDRVSYRGVTRVSVYTQPPMDGQRHIKEIIRKTITSAQKVIAVVMDLFTDVDIFQDLLDASFRRRVAVYIILEATGVPHFLSMCKKAAMHQGHLKNLRVRTAGGKVLHTHKHGKVCGQLSQKFIFVDGDKAVTGSYSYTWMASRLDRNLVTVLTGEAVEAFDRQFRELYLLSQGVSLDDIGLEAEPEPQPSSRLAVPSMPSTTVGQKHITPKYALLSMGSTNSSSVQNVVDGSSERSASRITGLPRPAVKILHQLREAEEPPVHPALQGMEKANMLYYLSTWPEPEPSIDGVEDCSEPPQACLTQAELDKTLQPIGFKDPFVLSSDFQEVPKEVKEDSSINLMSEQHCENLKTISAPSSTDTLGLQMSGEHNEYLRTSHCQSSTDTQEVEDKEKEVSSISEISEGHNANLRTTNEVSATDAQEVQKEAKEICSISATSEGHYENLGTANTLSNTDVQEVQKEAEEASGISVMSEDHDKDLGAATAAQGVQNEGKDISSISAMSEEHSLDLGTVKTAIPIDTQVVQDEDIEIPSISVILEEHHQNLKTINGQSTTNAQEIQKDKDISNIIATSEEHIGTFNPARSTVTEDEDVPNEETDISSISAALEEHHWRRSDFGENLKTTCSQNATDTQGVQNKAKEVSSIFMTSENLRTANDLNVTDAQEIQKEVKEDSSISNTSEEYYENLSTDDSADAMDIQGVQKETKEVSSIFAMSGEHIENPNTANSPSSTNTLEVKDKEKEVCRITMTSEEHNENLRTANELSVTDAQEVQEVAKKDSSISNTSEEYYENLRTDNSLDAMDTQGVQKESTDISSISGTSEEHSENLRAINSVRSTDTLVVHNNTNTKEDSSISVTLEEHENLRAANELSATDVQVVQLDAKEVSSISVMLEEDPENNDSVNSARSTDTQLVQNEEMDIFSISAALEEHLETLKTTNGQNTTDAQGVQNKAKEVSRIYETSEEHSENLRTAYELSVTDAQEIQKEAKEVTSISEMSCEHDENLTAANSPTSTNTQEVQNEEIDMSSSSVTLRGHNEDLTAAYELSATDNQKVQKEVKEVSSFSATSKEELYENPQPTKYGSASTESLQLEQSQVDELNSARASQPMVEQQLQEQSHPRHETRVLSKCSKEKPKTRKTHRQIQTDQWKPNQTPSRTLASQVHYQQVVPVWGFASTAGTRLDGHIQLPNLAGGIAGGHGFRHGNQLALSRPAWGGNHLSRDPSSSFRGFTSIWPDQTQLGSQAYLIPNRQFQGRPQGQLGWARPTRQGPAAAYRLPGLLGDVRGPPAPPPTRHTLFRVVNENAPRSFLSWG